jgi:hypothetical protein
MKPRGGAAFGLLVALVVAGCVQPPGGGDEGTSYTVMVIQPEEGGAIGASPARGPAGTTVKLSHTADDEYTFQHYTVDNTQIGGDSFTLSKDVTVSGVFARSGDRNADTPAEEVLPSLRAGEGAGTIVRDPQNPNVLNVSITIPAGAAVGEVGLTEGTNFVFAGKTFNFNIIFESGTYDEGMVNAIKGKFTVKGAAVGTVSTTPGKPGEPPVLNEATLKIDGVLITIPVPAGGAGTISVEAAVSNGAVEEFADPSGIVAGKVVNLLLSAPGGQGRINYSAISAVETAFKSKGAAAVSSDTTGGAIPVFHGTNLDITHTNNNIISELASRATQQNPDVKIINNINAIYNSGNQILEVNSPIALTGTIFCTELEKIRTTTNKIYADETLHILSGYNINVETITLEQLINVYMKCGFNFDGQNTFLPELGGCLSPIDNYTPMSLYITDTASSWDIYRLFERYYAAGKLGNLGKLDARYTTVAGPSAAGLYDANNQPRADFPYKVDGAIISFMNTNNYINKLENVYNDQYDISIGTVSANARDNLRVKNFASKNNITCAVVYASGACFFQYTPVVMTSTGAVKLMRAIRPEHSIVSAKYLDLRDLPAGDKALLGGIATEMAFPSPHMMYAEVDQGYFPYQIGYANDSSGVTRLIGTAAEGFNYSHASTRNTGIYGVLDLQGWADGNPPADKTAANFSAAEKWTAAEFNSLLQ